MPRPRHFGSLLRILLTASIAVAIVSIQGCSRNAPEFVEAGRTYSTDSVTLLLERSDAGELAKSPSMESKALRQQALTSLRREGEGAAEAASVITKAFPGDATGVPYYVERATYEGTSGWVILEARGPRGGTMQNRLLWVIDAEGEVLFSVMR